MIHGSGWMNSYHLVVLEGKVMASFLEMCRLQEEPREQCLPDGWVVLGVRHLPRGDLNSLLHSDTQELLSDIVARLHSPEVNVVVVAPVSTLLL